jgi:hypothetical protein
MAGSWHVRCARFGGTWVSRGAETGVPTMRSRPRVQVLDDGRGGLTGERRRASVPVGC